MLKQLYTFLWGIIFALSNNHEGNFQCMPFIFHDIGIPPRHKAVLRQHCRLSAFGSFKTDITSKAWDTIMTVITKVFFDAFSFVIHTNCHASLIIFSDNFIFTFRSKYLQCCHCFHLPLSGFYNEFFLALPWVMWKEKMSQGAKSVEYRVNSLFLCSVNCFTVQRFCAGALYWYIIQSSPTNPYNFYRWPCCR